MVKVLKGAVQVNGESNDFDEGQDEPSGNAQYQTTMLPNFNDMAPTNMHGLNPCRK